MAIEQSLSRRRALGLAVPEIPIGLPGIGVGNAVDAYNVLLVQADGTSRVYKAYLARRSAKISATL